MGISRGVGVLIKISSMEGYGYFMELHFTFPYIYNGSNVEKIEQLDDIE